MNVFLENLNKTKFNTILFSRNYSDFSAFLLVKNKSDEQVSLWYYLFVAF